MNLIKTSNARARYAVLLCKVFGRTPANLDRVRLAMRQRAVMRRQSALVQWLRERPPQLRTGFDRFVALHVWALKSHSSETVAVREYVMGEFNRN